MTELIININETMCNIQTVGKTVLNIKLLDDVCSFDIPNAKYTEKYKRGEWDGKYHLFNRFKRTFPTGLLTRVIDALEIYRYSYQLNYMYKQPELHKFNWKLENVELRDYQVESIDCAFKNKNGIIQVPTGGGKTTLASGIIEKFGLSTLFLCHTKDLLYQNYKVLHRLLPSAKIGLIGDGHVDIGDINIATIQTLAPKIEDNELTNGDRQYELDLKYGDDEPLVVNLKPTDISSEVVRDLIQRSEVLIFDECHHVPATTFYKIAMFSNAKIRFGLSATPKRDDGFDMKIESGIGNVIYRISLSKLIEEGYLARPNIKFIAVPQRAFGKKATFREVYQKYILDNNTRNEIIRSIAIEQIKNNKPTLILTKEVHHLNLLHDLIPESITIYGDLDGDERTKILNDFKYGRIKCLIGTTIADEGIDLPSIQCLILAGGGKSSVKAYQRVGRAIRLFDTCPKCSSYDVIIKSMNEPCICEKCGHKFSYNGKFDVDIYDFQDNTRKWLYDHYLFRKNLYEQEEEIDIKFRKIEIRTE